MRTLLVFTKEEWDAFRTRLTESLVWRMHERYRMERRGEEENVPAMKPGMYDAIVGDIKDVIDRRAQ